MITNSLKKFLNESEYTAYSLCSRKDGDICFLDERYILYPGSFNPLHSGHLDIVNAVVKIAKPPFQRRIIDKIQWLQDVVFEICIDRFDKPRMTEDEIKTIERQFISLNRAYVFTRLPSFVSKFSLGNHFSFVLGADTLIRLFDNKYYFNCLEEKERIMELFKLRKWYVAPRLNLHSCHASFVGSGLDLTWLNVYNNISSSEIRNKV